MTASIPASRCSGSCSTSRTCAPATRVRRSTRCEQHFGEQAAGHDDPAVDRLLRISRTGRLDPRLPAEARRRLPCRRRRAAEAAGARTGAQEAPAAQGLTAAHGLSTCAPCGLERDPHHIGPALDVGCQRRGDPLGIGRPAPRRARSARRRRSSRPSAPMLSGDPLDDLRRPRIQVGAVGLVQPVAEAAARPDRGRRAPSPSTSFDTAAMLRDGVGERHLARQRLRAPGGAHRASRHDQHRLEPVRRVDPVRRRRRHRRRSRRAARRRRCRDGPRAQSRAPAGRHRLEQVVGGDQSGDDPGGARPEAAAQRDRRAAPGTRGRRPDEAARRRARPGSRGRAGRAGRCVTRSWPVSSTSSSRWRPSAAASTSKPGPRFAVEAGTRTRTVTAHRRIARSIALSSGSHGITPPTCTERRVGVLEAVAGEHADDRARRPPAPWASRPATEAAEAGSQKTPSSRARNR